MSTLFSSKSSSTTTTTQTTQDQRVGAEGGGVAVGSGAEIDIMTTDGAAWEFGGAALDVVRDLASVAKSSAETAFGAAQSAIGQASQSPDDEGRSTLFVVLGAVLAFIVILRVT